MNRLHARRVALLAALLAPWQAFAGHHALRELKVLAGNADVPAIPAPSEGRGPQPVRWEDASKFIDYTVTVEGKVVRSYANDKVCFLNFSTGYKNTLTLVIFGSAYPKFPAGPQFFYKDKKVRVTGTIRKSSLGTLQIVINEPSEIVVTDRGEKAKVVYWEDVTAEMKGQQVTIEGTVHSVGGGGKVAYLNFHPNWTRYVTGTIFATAFRQFPPNLKEAYEGKLVRLSGVVDVYEGRPQVLLYSSAQVQVQGAQSPAVKRLLLDKDKIVYDDGDTISYAFSAEDGVVGADGKPYAGHLRLLGYDTPEIFHPEDGIFYSQPKGLEAARLSASLIRKAKKVRFTTFGQLDKYNRVLGHLVLDNELLAVSVLRAGLAYEMVTPFGDNGFPAEAEQVMDAWGKSPVAVAIEAGKRPPFQKPGDWRKENQVHELAVPLEKWEAWSAAKRKAYIAKVKAAIAERRGQAKP